MSDVVGQPASSAQSPKRRAPEHSRTSSAGRNAPVAFFFRTEEQVQGASASEEVPLTSAESSTYGVQSLASTSSSTQASGYLPHEENSHKDQLSLQTRDSRSSDATVLPDIKPESPTDQDRRPRRTPSLSSQGSSPHRPLSHNVSATALAGRLTPFHLHSPVGDIDTGPAGTPKSVSIRSLRLSDEESVNDETGSQAITSGDEDEEAGQYSPPAAFTQDAPQLVMPNLRLPSRRPFTQRGKDIGKLKVMVAGARGIGKTSLIKSMVQVCEDIVHVDSLTNSTFSTSTVQQRSSRQQSDPFGSSVLTCPMEILASTRAYPQWWSDLGESKVLRRRQSMGEQVLERNICFVDTPGFDPNSLVADETASTVAYVEACLMRNLSFDSLADGEILGILSGNGGLQVDLILYMLSTELTTRDIEVMRVLATLSQVVPVIAKSDLMSADDLANMETTLAQELREAEVDITALEYFSSLDQTATSHPRIWSISSAPGNDNDNMDASLLMSPDYIQPLVPSNLSSMISKIFDPETAAYLRHTAAKKFLRWRISKQALSHESAVKISRVSSPHALPSSPSPALSSSAEHDQDMNQGSLPLHGSSSPTSNQLLVPSPPTHSIARILDHTQREERLAQVRLAWWAADLQRSLANERARFSALHHDERKGWLLERVGEIAQSEQDATDAENNTLFAHNSPYHGTLKYQMSNLDIASFYPGLAMKDAVLATDLHDPLGLLALDAHIRRNGLVVFKVLGGCGFLGAMVIWVMRSWSRELGFGSHPSSWSGGWFFGYGCGCAE